MPSTRCSPQQPRTLQGHRQFALAAPALELIISDRPLRAAMLDYSVNIVWLAALISIITAGLLYFTINRLLVRPGAPPDRRTSSPSPRRRRTPPA